MISTFSLDIFSVSFFRCGVIAQPMRFAAMRYTSAPFILVKYDAHKAGFISFVWFTDILRIAFRTNYSQIFKTIIRFIAVYMVNNVFWPFASYIKPYKSVRFINAPLDSYGNISFLVGAPCSVANLDGFARSNSPRKKPRIGVVSQCFSQLFCCKFGHAPSIAFSS